jgi:hypothetical protein
MLRALSAPLGILAMTFVVTGCGTAPLAPRSEASPPTVSSSQSAAPTPHLVTVPRIRPYVSVERAKRELARVGLVGESPDVNFPHYFVGTEPTSGTEVEVGSTVQLIIGDG